MMSMLDDDGLRGGGVWGLLVFMALSLSVPASLSASLPLSGGVAFSELSEAERESAHIRSRSTSEAEEGRRGAVNDVANGLERRESERYLGESKLGRRKRQRRGFKPLKSSLGDWRGDEEARRAKSVDEVGREDLGRWGLLDMVRSGITYCGEVYRTRPLNSRYNCPFRGHSHNRPALTSPFIGPFKFAADNIRILFEEWHPLPDI